MTKQPAASAGGEPTFIQRARRKQIIDATVGLVAEQGYAGASLGRIAERAGITKPAVLYHFPSKAAVVQAAYEHVLDRLVAHVAAAVEAAPDTDGPAAYARAMVAYLDANRLHTRMVVEALRDREGDRDTAARWRPLAHIIETARAARGLAPDPDARTMALIIGGAIDAIVSEMLQDPEYDATAAASYLADVIETAHSA